MKVAFEFNYGLFAAEVTAAELEVFQRVTERAVSVAATYDRTKVKAKPLSGQDVAVISIQIVPSTTSITPTPDEEPTNPG